MLSASFDACMRRRARGGGLLVRSWLVDCSGRSPSRACCHCRTSVPVVRMDKYRGSAWSRRKRHGPPEGKLPLGQASTITHGQASGCDSWFGSLLFFQNMVLFHIDPTPPTLPHTLDRCSSNSPASQSSTDRVDRTGRQPRPPSLIFIHGRPWAQEDTLPGPPEEAHPRRIARAAPSTVCMEAYSENGREGGAARLVKVGGQGR